MRYIVAGATDVFCSTICTVKAGSVQQKSATAFKADVVRRAVPRILSRNPEMSSAKIRAFSTAAFEA